MLVEGTDDEHVIKHICGSYDFFLDEVSPEGGVNELLGAVSTRLDLLSGDGDALGVVTDADDSPDARWQSLRDIFVNAGYPNVPRRPDPDGTVLESPDGNLAAPRRRLDYAGQQVPRHFGGFSQIPNPKPAQPAFRSRRAQRGDGSGAAVWRERCAQSPYPHLARVAR